MFPKNNHMGKVTSRLGRGLGGIIAGGGAKPDSASKDNLSSGSDKLVPPLVQEPPMLAKKKETLRAEEFQEVMVKQVVSNPYQPRKSMDSASIEELAESIKSEGLLQPIVVREKEGKFELIAGERRLLAHQKLGKDKILARVVTKTNLSSASLALIENLQREQLNPIDEALGYSTLVNDFGLTQAKVAERVGKSRVYVTNLLRILKIHDQLKPFLSEGKLSTGHAKVLLALDNPEDQLRLGKRAVAEGWSVRLCETEVNRFLHPSVSSTVISRTSSVGHFSSLAQKFESKLGRSVRIAGSPSGKGKIILEFKNETDLENLLSDLGL